MIGALLEERFNLKLRRDTRDVPVYVLTADANASQKLTPAKEASRRGAGFVSVGPYNDLTNLRPPRLGYGAAVAGGIGAFSKSIDQLANDIAWVTRRPVLNRTGITGYFSFEIFFAPADLYPDSPAINRAVQEGSPILTSPSLFKVLEDELGLKLESSRAPVEVLVIESVERPSEN
jgi:uncharacterized protein (TIGR03435 family)